MMRLIELASQGLLSVFEALPPAARHAITLILAGIPFGIAYADNSNAVSMAQENAKAALQLARADHELIHTLSDRINVHADRLDNLDHSLAHLQSTEDTVLQILISSQKQKRSGG